MMVTRLKKNADRAGPMNVRRRPQVGFSTFVLQLRYTFRVPLPEFLFVFRSFPIVFRRPIDDSHVPACVIRFPSLK
jgi:hypothetical protein